MNLFNEINHARAVFPEAHDVYVPNRKWAALYIEGLMDGLGCEAMTFAKPSDVEAQIGASGWLIRFQPEAVKWLPQEPRDYARMIGDHPFAVPCLETKIGLEAVAHGVAAGIDRDRNHVLIAAILRDLEEHAEAILDEWEGLYGN